METFIARVQAALTLVIVLAWIILIVGSAFGYGTGGDAMKEVVMIAVGFWLLRPRAASGAGNGDKNPPPAPTS